MPSQWPAGERPPLWMACSVSETLLPEELHSLSHHQPGTTSMIYANTATWLCYKPTPWLSTDHLSFSKQETLNWLKKTASSASLTIHPTTVPKNLLSCYCDAETKCSTSTINSVGIEKLFSTYVCNVWTSASCDLAISTSVLAAGCTTSRSFIIVAPSLDIDALPVSAKCTTRNSDKTSE